MVPSSVTLVSEVRTRPNRYTGSHSRNVNKLVYPRHKARPRDGSYSEHGRSSPWLSSRHRPYLAQGSQPWRCLSYTKELLHPLLSPHQCSHGAPLEVAANPPRVDKVPYPRSFKGISTPVGSNLRGMHHHLRHDCERRGLIQEEEEVVHASLPCLKVSACICRVR